MTDDEINAGFKAMAEHLAGTVQALTQVIQALQAQPGYDHQAFLAYLAATQVVGEQMAMQAPELDNALRDTLLRFATKPTPAAPFLGGRTRP